MEDNELRQHLTDVQIKYIDMLMTLLHVVGVGIGLAKEQGEYTQQMALIVMVERKVPVTDLPPADVVPRELDGVRVDVQEIGILSAF